MKNLLTHMVSAFLGAFMVVVLLIAFDLVGTVLPINIPNIFYKERIDYYVKVDSAVSNAIETANQNIVGVTTYTDAGVSTGSGVIYKLTDDKAYIVTNYHVVKDANQVEIETTSGFVKDATIVGSDKITDLAVLTVSRGLIDHYIEMADSGALTIGEFVIAIGNPLGLSETSTLGIVSSLNRRISVDIDEDGDDDWFASVIQTDAAINPGNSGGALINLDGKLVGINSMKIANEQVEGIGFSIPTKLVDKIISDIEVNGKVIRPFLGIRFVTNTVTTDYDYGILIREVDVESSAANQGLQSGDIILEVNGDEIKQDIDFITVIYNSEVGDTLNLKILRDQQEMTIDIVLESKKD